MSDSSNFFGRIRIRSFTTHQLCILETVDVLSVFLGCIYFIPLNQTLSYHFNDSHFPRLTKIFSRRGDITAPSGGEGVDLKVIRLGETIHINQSESLGGIYQAYIGHTNSFHRLIFIAEVCISLIHHILAG